MAAPSSLSVAARALRTHVAGAVGLPEGQILIGHPSLAAKDAEGDANKQFLNLFFYRVEHGAYPSDSAANDALHVRFYCLITALGAKETGPGGSTVSAGENDLRLVGAVMRRLNESPVLRLRDTAAEEVAQLQVVQHALSLDDLNHIWSTQGDTPYRLSVGYELALLPLPLARPALRGSRVGAIGVQVEGEPMVRAPEVPAVRVDLSRPDWVPHICWLAADGSLQYSLVFARDAVPASLQVIPLGAPGSDVDLHWELWDPAAADAKWTRTAAAPPTLSVEVDAIDPAADGTSSFPLAFNVTFPIAARGQAVLYASRLHTRPDGVQVTLRSNPLLVSVHAP